MYCCCMLPEPIAKELYDIRYIASDMVVAYICESIERLLYAITNITNNDLAITVAFNNDSVQCELRIDRIYRQFELTLHDGVYMYIPIRTADWGDIMTCLTRFSNV